MFRKKKVSLVYMSECNSYDSVVDELNESFEFDVKCAWAFQFYDQCCPEIRAFDRAKLKPIDHKYRVAYNKVIEEFKSSDVKLNRVRPLSWSRWVNRLMFGVSDYKAPDYKIFSNK